MNGAYYFYCEMNFLFHNKEKIDFQIFVIYINDTTIKTLLLKILVTNMIFSGKIGDNHFPPLYVGKIWAYIDIFYSPNSDFKGKHACSGPKHTSKRQVHDIFFFTNKLRWNKWNHLKQFKMCKQISRLKTIQKIMKLRP